MGDMADLTLEQDMDTEDYYEDARSGWHGSEAELEAEDYFGNMPSDDIFCSGFNKTAHQKTRKQQIVKSSYWEYFHGYDYDLEEITGKYLFFSEDRKRLVQIVRVEIKDHGFKIAKISRQRSHEDFVLCLYWHDDSRKNELAERYVEQQNIKIKYRYWKSDADTQAGKYSNVY